VHVIGLLFPFDVVLCSTQSTGDKMTDGVF